MIPQGGVNHHGEYNPWDELKRPEVKAAADAAIASGGYVYRTGVCHVTPGRVTFDRDGNIRFGEPSYYHTGDGINIIRIEREEDRTG